MSRALFGRDPDLQALAALMDGHRLVSIVGSGGDREAVHRYYE